MNTDYGSYEIPFSLSGKRASFHFAMALAHVCRWRTFERHGPPLSDQREGIGQTGANRWAKLVFRLKRLNTWQAAFPSLPNRRS